MSNGDFPGAYPVWRNHGERSWWVWVTLSGSFVLSTASCASSGEPWIGPAVTDARQAASKPTFVSGGKDCGTNNLLSGWPTTAVPSGAKSMACLVDALASGTPAHMVVISAGQGDSGRKTFDGYDLPTHHVVTWLVLGKAKLKQTTDATEYGGKVTTHACGGLSLDLTGLPMATDCIPL